VFRSLAARWDLSRAAPGSDVPGIMELVWILILLVVLITVPVAEPDIGTGTRGVAIAVALGVCAVIYIAWLVVRRQWRTPVPLLAAMGISGGVLAGMTPFTPSVAIVITVVSVSTPRLKPETSLSITVAMAGAFLAGGLSTGATAGTLLGYPLGFVGVWAFGLTRRAFLSRAEQAERTLVETQRAREAETQAAALAERARIAREIHDVLAHSLAAVSVNLQAAEGLLTAGTLPAGNPELTKAIECIDRAGAFTREGLADARRAILALRDDAVPLVDQFASLAREYGAAGGSAVDFEMTGTPRPVPAEVGLAAYRTAQEALTNARKHAPGEPVRLRLAYEDGWVTVTVSNPLPPSSADRPLTATGAGYGLTGLAERATLAGGTLDTGATDGQWRVWLRIPA